LSKALLKRRNKQALMGLGALAGKAAIARILFSVTSSNKLEF
jgi:hypothetical protein